MKPNIIIFNPDQMRADALGKFKLEVQATEGLGGPIIGLSEKYQVMALI